MFHNTSPLEYLGTRVNPGIEVRGCQSERGTIQLQVNDPPFRMLRINRYHDFGESVTIKFCPRLNFRISVHDAKNPRLTFSSEVILFTKSVQNQSIFERFWTVSPLITAKNPKNFRALRAQGFGVPKKFPRFARGGYIFYKIL